MGKFKWTKKQVKALECSIVKWEKIVAGSGRDAGPENCPCCRIWHQNYQPEKVSCVGCPICLYSCHDMCAETPYSEWEGFADEDEDGRFVTNAKTLKMAKAELAFLKKVLKAGINKSARKNE